MILDSQATSRGCVYISGGITGIPNWMDNFNALARQLRAQNYEVANPAEFEWNKIELSWAENMKRDIAVLVTCDAIALLPGWHKSKGARIEYQLAVDLGLDVI